LVTGKYFRKVERRTKDGIVGVREELSLCRVCDLKYSGKKAKKKSKKAEGGFELFKL
jgi:hypothetical protein